MYVTSILHVLVVNNLNKFQMNVKVYALSKKASLSHYCKVSTDLVQYVKHYSVNAVKYFYASFKHLMVQNL